MKPTCFLVALLALLSGCTEAVPEEPVAGPVVQEEPVTPLAFTVDAVPAVTQNDTVTITGSVDSPAQVVASHTGRSFGAGESNGAWAIEVQLDAGQNAITLSADDGHEVVTEQVMITRLLPATLSVEYGEYPGATDRTDALWYDVSTLDSAAMYDDVSSSHPGFYTVHDLLVLWEATTAVDVVFSHSDGLGFSVSQIDGAGNPVSTSAPPYWCYTLNDSSDILGASGQPIESGDAVTWYLGTCSR